MTKKTQIFIFDMIFAVIILILALSLYYTYFLHVDDNSKMHELNIDILNRFTNLNINSLNNQGVRNLFIQGKIQNIEHTVAQQVVEFYHEGNTGDAENLTSIFIADYITKDLHFMLSLANSTGGDNFTLYKYPPTFVIDFEDAKISTLSQRLVFSFENQSTFYGPYRFTVQIWK